ncbi:MAG: type II toxin-antitoxin system HipA family toxin [Granulosicoccus sp.]|nr:type II toxin-antitoxin system HipA family toxin [Granulosicoccus sp.]
MGRRRSHTPLNVFLNTRRVGVLSRDKSGATKFSYDPLWLDWEHALPVSISLPLREDTFTGAQVMSVFDNLLPDYEPIRRRVAERVGAQGTDAFSLLSEIGRDCIGALQFLPAGQEPSPTDQLGGRILSEADIADLLRHLDVSPLGIRSDVDFRISIAGAQEKTALLQLDNDWLEPSGTTPTTHIIKPQIGRLANGMDLSHSVENEYLCLKLMAGFGLKTAEARIMEFEETTALVITRFDRHWTPDGRLIRLPQEDCCQALSVPPTLKYQNEGGPGIVEVMDLLRGSDEPNRDRHDFFKSQILFWLIGATDGHAKNFSLALTSQGRFRMTPLYDVLTLQEAFDNRQLTHKDFKLAMRVGTSNQYNIERIRGRHFIDSGILAGLSRTTILQVFDEIRSTAATAIQEVFDALPPGFPQTLTESVSAAVDRRLELLVPHRVTTR